MTSRWQIGLVGGLTVIAGLILLPSPGSNNTQWFWLPWMQKLSHAGVVGGYAANQSDYPPLSQFFFGLAVLLDGAFRIGSASGLKLVLLVCLLLATLIMWRWTRSPWLTISVPLSLTLGSLGLALVDVFLAPTWLLAVWSLQRERWTWFASLFTVTCLIKWQPLIIAPFFAVYVLDRFSNGRSLHIRWRDLLTTMGVPVMAIGLLVYLAFGTAILASLGRALNHPYLSGDAFNFNQILTWLLRVLFPSAVGGLTDGAALHLVGVDWRMQILPKLLFTAFYTLTFIAWLRRPKTPASLLLFSSIGYLSYFMFNTGVHENHLFLAQLLLAALVAVEPGCRREFVLWSLAANLNLLIVWGVDGHGSPFGRVVWGVDLAVIIALGLVLLFLRLFQHIVSPTLRGAAAS